MFVVIAGTKGKERFWRPLCIGSNSNWLCCLSLPPLSSMCRSPLGAGVPAEVRWSWLRHVFGKGFTCLSLISLLLVLLHSSSSPIIWPFSFRPPTTSLFSISTLPYSFKCSTSPILPSLVFIIYRLLVVLA